jgi:Flp pilus assembly protein TadD
MRGILGICGSPTTAAAAAASCPSDGSSRLLRLLASTALALACGGWAGCAQAPPPRPESLFHDAWFEARAPVPDTAALLALSEPMRHFLRSESGLQPRAAQRERALLEALQRDGKLRLEYDGSRTRTAAQAFEARAGNCLSLVLMTAALAREMNLQVTFQLVEADLQWSRRGALLLGSQHVNLRLGAAASADRRLLVQHELIVDFLPPEDLQRRRVQPIDEARVLAMYLNNRAAEHLADGRLDDAYAHARAALRADPGHIPAYGTLGVTYGRRGARAEAVATLEAARRLAPADLATLSNLVVALRRQGDLARADAMAAELARLEPDPPLAAYERGLAALGEGNAAAAVNHFERELQRNPDQPEVHHALAIALFRLGEREASRRHLAEAEQLGTSPEARRRYAAKLEWLRQLP